MKRFQIFNSSITTMKDDIRNQGFQKAFTKHRWKLILLIVVYYLIRDIFLYVVLPACISLSWNLY